jgi:2-dehydropantoate 2-reductase
MHSGDLMRPREIAGHPRSGGSTWQSLARGLPLETEHLNGEIVRLGRLHGVPTPVNTAVTARTLTVDALHLTD